MYSAPFALISMLVAQHGSPEAVPAGDSGSSGKGKTITACQAATEFGNLE